MSPSIYSLVFGGHVIPLPLQKCRPTGRVTVAPRHREGPIIGHWQHWFYNRDMHGRKHVLRQLHLAPVLYRGPPFTAISWTNDSRYKVLHMYVHAHACMTGWLSIRDRPCLLRPITETTPGWQAHKQTQQAPTIMVGWKIKLFLRYFSHSSAPKSLRVKAPADSMTLKIRTWLFSPLSHHCYGESVTVLVEHCKDLNEHFLSYFWF